MKIAEMRVTPIAITDPPLRNAAGLHAPYALRTIVELVTTDNIYGLGEVPGNVDITAALESAREIVIGRDPFHLNGLQMVLHEHFSENDTEGRSQTPWVQRILGYVNSALEVACLDIIGKATNRPVGAVRDQVPFSAYLFFKHRGAGGTLAFDTDPNATGWAAARQAEALTPEAIVTQAQAMCDAFGFKSIKLKAGTLEPDIEVASIFALRDAFGPTMPLRIDPNGVWSVAQNGRRVGILRGPGTRPGEYGRGSTSR
jgi:glucarate dehydratase